MLNDLVGQVISLWHQAHPNHLLRLMPLTTLQAGKKYEIDNDENYVMVTVVQLV